ncbi:MAG: TIGR04551 family protein, partial [Myxococcales bacterium]|nr:TIGR04551 family protein [Myxococcales bacterium]
MLVTAGAQAQQPTEPAAGGQPRPATGATSAAPEPESGEAAHDDLIPQGAGPNDGTPHVDPSTDQQKLVQQGRERPTADGSVGARPSEVYSEDWWAHTRPIVEVHGYFRTRGELFHNFALGRHPGLDGDGQNLWAQPRDNTFTNQRGKREQVLLCQEPNAAGQFSECYDKSQATANLRLRLNPEIHISDNLRIMTQIDLLDNLVLGSTPDAYALRPSGVGTTGYSPAVNGYNGYAPLGAFTTTQGPPTAGVNGYRNSIDVQRAWAEYLTPVGQLRFGRMPTHWGLGMVANAGDCID